MICSKVGCISTMTQALTFLLVLSAVIESILSAARLPNASSETVLAKLETKSMTTDQDFNNRYADFWPEHWREIMSSEQKRYFMPRKGDVGDTGYPEQIQPSQLKVEMIRKRHEDYSPPKPTKGEGTIRLQKVTPINSTDLNKDRRKT